MFNKDNIHISGIVSYTHVIKNSCIREFIWCFIQSDLRYDVLLCTHEKYEINGFKYDKKISLIKRQTNIKWLVYYQIIMYLIKNYKGFGVWEYFGCVYTVDHDPGENSDGFRFQILSDYE